MGKTVRDLLEVATFKKMNHQMYNELDDEQRMVYRDKLLRELDNDLQSKILMECIQQRYRKHFNRLLDEEDAEATLPLLKEINDYERKKDEETVKSDYCFITLSPDPAKNVSLCEFKKTVEKASKKSFIKKSLYVIEQRSDTEENMGSGMHCHMLINKGDYRMSHMKREFKQTFKNMIDCDNPGPFNFKLCKEKDLQKRQTYMLGDKKDEAKQLKQIIDKKWRVKCNIEEYYGEKFDEDIAQLAAGL